jgi:hypothetical protein
MELEQETSLVDWLLWRAGRRGAAERNDPARATSTDINGHVNKPKRLKIPKGRLFGCALPHSAAASVSPRPSSMQLTTPPVYIQTMGVCCGPWTAKYIIVATSEMAWRRQDVARAGVEILGLVVAERRRSHANQTIRWLLAVADDRRPQTKLADMYVTNFHIVSIGSCSTVRKTVSLTRLLLCLAGQLARIDSSFAKPTAARDPTARKSNWADFFRYSALLISTMARRRRHGRVGKNKTKRTTTILQRPSCRRQFPTYGTSRAKEEQGR